MATGAAGNNIESFTRTILLENPRTTIVVAVVVNFAVIVSWSFERPYFAYLLIV